MTTPTQEMVTVEIQVTEQVIYNKIVEMTKAEYEKLDKELDNAAWSDQEDIAETIVASYINKNNDWIDSSGLEIDKFKIYEAPDDSCDELPF